jgi:hypothetical protein
MSRSFKSTSITGNTTAVSDKSFKKMASKRYRHKIRQLLRQDWRIVDEYVLPDEYDITNPATSNKDGKQYFNPEEHPDLMRK